MPGASHYKPNAEDGLFPALAMLRAQHANVEKARARVRLQEQRVRGRAELGCPADPRSVALLDAMREAAERLAALAAQHVLLLRAREASRRLLRGALVVIIDDEPSILRALSRLLRAV